MTKADKLRLLRNLPKKAIYIRQCITAFWDMDIKQDLSLTANTGAEPFWHNARYTLRASPDVVHFFSHYIQVELLSDIFEANSGRLARSNRVFTGNGWYHFIDDMYYNAENRRLDVAEAHPFRKFP